MRDAIDARLTSLVRNADARATRIGAGPARRRVLVCAALLLAPRLAWFVDRRVGEAFEGMWFVLVSRSAYWRPAKPRDLAGRLRSLAPALEREEVQAQLAGDHALAKCFATAARHAHECDPCFVRDLRAMLRTSRVEELAPYRWPLRMLHGGRR